MWFIGFPHEVRRAQPCPLIHLQQIVQGPVFLRCARQVQVDNRDKSYLADAGVPDKSGSRLTHTRWLTSVPMRRISGDLPQACPIGKLLRRRAFWHIRAGKCL